jgi:hypothetical protein
MTSNFSSQVFNERFRFLQINPSYATELTVKVFDYNTVRGWPKHSSGDECSRQCPCPTCSRLQGLCWCCSTLEPTVLALAELA